MSEKLCRYFQNLNSVSKSDGVTETDACCDKEREWELNYTRGLQLNLHNQSITNISYLNSCEILWKPKISLFHKMCTVGLRLHLALVWFMKESRWYGGLLCVNLPLFGLRATNAGSNTQSTHLGLKGVVLTDGMITGHYLAQRVRGATEGVSPPPCCLCLSPEWTEVVRTHVSNVTGHLLKEPGMLMSQFSWQTSGKLTHHPSVINILIF